jgi:adenosylmethionine-8-amino-7-oxononanoate aminotransferase
VIREICDRHNVLFVADEVMTALGRTGKMWGIDHWNVMPDIIAVSKSLACGYFPVAAMITWHAILETLRRDNAHFRTGHTLNASAVGMAAATETIKYIQEHDLVENARAVGDYLLEQL